MLQHATSTQRKNAAENKTHKHKCKP